MSEQCLICREWFEKPHIQMSWDGDWYCCRCMLRPCEQCGVGRLSPKP